MSYLRGPDRSDVQLLPPCLDDYVPENAPVRFLDVYVEGLDLGALGFAHAQPKATGRPPYHPADLLKLYLYGYLNRIRSSRRLEAEAARNLEAKWLLRGVTPDFRTIADFRKNNRTAFPPLFKAFNLLCRKLDLFGAELVAIDGCKFKAVNNPKRHFTKDELQDLLKKVEQRIDEYLKELDQKDSEAEGVAAAPSRQELTQKIAELKERKGKYDQLAQELTQSGEKEISLTDADSRMMKGPHGEHFVGYNVQAAVDAKHHLIVAQEVVQAGNDRGQLSAMAVAAKEALGVAKLEVVADKGYHEADQLQRCQEAGISAIVPEPGTTSGRSKGGREVFPKERFRYDALADAYECPAGQMLRRASVNASHGKKKDLLYYNRQACRECPLKAQCTSGKNRVIRRLANQPVVEATAQRTQAKPEVVKARKTIIEHVFGTVRNWCHDRFLMRGKEKVRAETSLTALTYNLRRVLNLVGWTELMKAVSPVGAA